MMLLAFYFLLGDLLGEGGCKVLKLLEGFLLLSAYIVLKTLSRESYQGVNYSKLTLALILFMLSLLTIILSQFHQLGQLAQLGHRLHPRVLLIFPGQRVFVVGVPGSHVHLPRTTDSIQVFVHHLAPVSHPPCTSRYCKQHCEHILGDTDRLVDYSCVKIYVWVQFPLDEVVICKCLFLEVDG